MNRTYCRVLILIAVLCVAAALDAKPNLTGTWKLNTSKSSFGDFPPPSSMSQKVTHEDPSLKISTQMSTENGDFDFDATYSTDGKETTNYFGPAAMKTVAKWEGDALAVESKGDFGDGELTISDKWEVSADGKVLTINRHFSGSRGVLDQKLVLEKQ